MSTRNLVPCSVACFLHCIWFIITHAAALRLKVANTLPVARGYTLPVAYILLTLSEGQEMIDLGPFYDTSLATKRRQSIISFDEATGSSLYYRRVRCRHYNRPSRILSLHLSASGHPYKFQLFQEFIMVPRDPLGAFHLLRRNANRHIRSRR